MKLNNLILLTFICLLTFHNCYNKNEIQKNDILALLLKKPGQLEFVDCKEGSGQIVLEAKYKVSGTNAHIIEEFIHKKTGMNKLKFACCGWETHPDGVLAITDKFNNQFDKTYDYNHISISMHSQETLVKDRKDWQKIPYFYIIVKVLKV